MWSRDLPRLVTQDTPTADIVPLAGGPRRRASWVLGGAVALLLGAGVSASLVSNPGEASHDVGSAAVDELSMPREASTTALRDDPAPGGIQALKGNAGAPRGPGQPHL
ncbi:MAG: hypothetical protein RBU30_22720 [Polyangia bacterium]|jgi:hypothetical protein|nr:hypothetical protein [Polyangia bacterium]